MKPQLVLHLHKAMQLERNKGRETFDSPYAMFIKYDGNYVYMDVVDGVPDVVRSRTLKPVASLAGHNQILFDNLHHIKANRVRYILEVTVPGVPFHVANGMFNRTKGDCVIPFNNVIYYLHDIVNLDHNYVTFEERYLNQADYIANCITTYHDNIEVLQPIEITSNIERMFTLGTEIIAKGHEGIVGKNINSRYEYGKRTQNMIKIKIEEAIPVKILGYEFTVGDKGNEGCVLQVNVISTKATQTITVNDTADRDLIANRWNSSVLNKVVNVNCMSILPSGKLREPRLNVSLVEQFGKVV